MFTAAALQTALSKHGVGESHHRYAVALSGGADSLALLIALLETVSEERVLGLHFNHQIHPDAQHWQQKCQTLCDSRKVRFQTAAWSRENSASQPGEVDARNARYQWFEQVLPETHILLTGHHLDDQVETVLMNLAEGRSLDRIAGIAGKRFLAYGDERRVIRPLLDFRHEQLCQFLRDRGIEWIEDPANADPQHSRTLLRQHIIPTMSERWPNTVGSVARAANDLSEALLLIEEVSDTTIIECGRPALRTLFCRSTPLCLEVLLQLSELRFSATIRRWVHRGGSPSPTRKQLDELKRQLLHVDAESHCRIDCGDASIQYFDGHLYLTQALSLSDGFDKECQKPPHSIRPGLMVEFEQSSLGIDESLLKSGKLRWQSRQGSHRFANASGLSSTSVKKSMQENRIAPWIRRSLPLLTLGKEVVWAHGLGVNPRFRITSASEPGVVPVFILSRET